MKNIKTKKNSFFKIKIFDFNEERFKKQLKRYFNFIVASKSEKLKIR